MKTKRIASAILCLAMALTLLPATAMAQEEITTTGLDLTSSTPTSITTYAAGNGTVTWDPTMEADPAVLVGGTLTLNSA